MTREIENQFSTTTDTCTCCIVYGFTIFLCLYLAIQTVSIFRNLIYWFFQSTVLYLLSLKKCFKTWRNWLWVQRSLFVSYLFILEKKISIEMCLFIFMQIKLMTQKWSIKIIRIYPGLLPNHIVNDKCHIFFLGICILFTTFYQELPNLTKHWRYPSE